MAVTFYLVAYFAATLVAFGVVTVLSTPERDADRIEDYRGLAARRPALAAAFAVALFSLAGDAAHGGLHRQVLRGDRRGRRRAVGAGRRPWC